MEIDQFVEDVMPFTPGLSKSVIRKWVISTIREFCSYCHVLVEEEQLVIVDGLYEYQVSPSTQYEVVSIRRAQTGGGDIEICSSACVKPSSSLIIIHDRGADFKISTPLGQPEPVLNMSYSVRPMLSATDLKEEIYSDWNQEILNGTLAKVFMLPGRDFSDPGRASFYQSVFDQSKHKAKLESILGRSGSVITAPPQRF